MVLIYMILSFAFLVSAMACFWKLAARMLRYQGVTWPIAFLVGATLVFAAVFTRGMASTLATHGFRLPTWLALIVGPALTIGIGAWCVHDRATRPTGEPLDWPGALQLSGLAMVLYLLPVVVLLGAAALVTD
jgi:hypothetical protein